MLSGSRVALSAAAEAASVLGGTTSVHPGAAERMPSATTPAAGAWDA